MGTLSTTVAGALDLFASEWHEYDWGRELRCNNARTLIAYACSESARGAKTQSESTQGIPRATIDIVGPVCEDGYPLYVSYRLSRSDFGKIDSDEQEAFRKALFALLEKRPTWRLLAVVGVGK